MEELMESFAPKVGDVILIPAKTVHAIGAGCLILEIQEPTDFTIQPERWCGEYKLSDEEMYLGLEPEDAFDCFDFGDTPCATVIPKITKSESGVTEVTLIDKSLTPCFVVNRKKCQGGELCLDVKDSYGVYIVTEGAGELVGEGYLHPLTKGSYFFLPAAAMGKYTLRGTLEVIECY